MTPKQHLKNIAYIVAFAVIAAIITVSIYNLVRD